MAKCANEGCTNEATPKRGQARRYCSPKCNHEATTRKTTHRAAEARRAMSRADRAQCSQAKRIKVRERHRKQRLADGDVIEHTAHVSDALLWEVA